MQALPELFFILTAGPNFAHGTFLVEKGIQGFSHAVLLPITIPVLFADSCRCNFVDKSDLRESLKSQL